LEPDRALGWSDFAAGATGAGAATAVVVVDGDDVAVVEVAAPRPTTAPAASAVADVVVVVAPAADEPDEPDERVAAVVVVCPTVVVVAADASLTTTGTDADPRDSAPVRLLVPHAVTVSVLRPGATFDTSRVSENSMVAAAGYVPASLAPPRVASTRVSVPTGRADAVPVTWTVPATDAFGAGESIVTTPVRPPPLPQLSSWAAAPVGALARRAAASATKRADRARRADT
jgi:hypothetical protein